MEEGCRVSFVYECFVRRGVHCGVEDDKTIIALDKPLNGCKVVKIPSKWVREDRRKIRDTSSDR